MISIRIQILGPQARHTNHLLLWTVILFIYMFLIHF